LVPSVNELIVQRRNVDKNTAKFEGRFLRGSFLIL
jgi:hypothetical protein